MIVATVLKSGGEYTIDHVHKLQRMVEKFVPCEKFVCFTDLEPESKIIPLQNNLQGWWSKIELFRVNDDVLYFDLDTIILKDMSKTLQKVHGKKFVILRDVYRGRADDKAMQSSIMYWSGDHSYIYKAFMDNPNFKLSGDQEFLEIVVKQAEYWQDITSGIVSYKADILRRGLQETDECIIFHGKPRPWEQNVLNYN